MHAATHLALYMPVESSALVVVYANYNYISFSTEIEIIFNHCYFELFYFSFYKYKALINQNIVIMILYRSREVLLLAGWFGTTFVRGLGSDLVVRRQWFPQMVSCGEAVWLRL